MWDAVVAHCVSPTLSILFCVPGTTPLTWHQWSSTGHRFLNTPETMLDLVWQLWQRLTSLTRQCVNTTKPYNKSLAGVKYAKLRFAHTERVGGSINCMFPCWESYKAVESYSDIRMIALEVVVSAAFIKNKLSLQSKQSKVTILMFKALMFQSLSQHQSPAVVFIWRHLAWCSVKYQEVDE